MIDFKKLEFKQHLSNIIERHPDWVNAAHEAIQEGLSEAIEKWQKELGRTAVILLQFYIKDKTGREVDDADKKGAIDFLGKYFNKEAL